MLVMLHRTILSFNLKAHILHICGNFRVSAMPGDMFNANFVASTFLYCAAF